MALVYLDLIKLAVPASMREQEPFAEAQYIVFGAYDFLHYALPGQGKGCGLAWLEQQHEERHDLDWNCERHPVFLYCADEDERRVQQILEPASHADRPLVLTMVRIIKHPLRQGKPSLICLIRDLQRAVEAELAGSHDIELVTCWNLGNADFLLLSRPTRLQTLRDLFLTLGRKGFRFANSGRGSTFMKFASFSSYCAFPLSISKDKRLDEMALGAWLTADTELQFINFVDTFADPNDIDSSFDDRRFLLGDRDYQLFDNLDAQSAGRIDSVMSIVKKLLDRDSVTSIRSSSLIPSLPVQSSKGDTALSQLQVSGVPSEPEVNTIDTYSPRLCDLTAAGKSVTSALEGMRCIAESRCEILEHSRSKYVRQIDHCINTLDALYKYAERLYAAAYQDDIFAIVKGLYASLSCNLRVYATKMNKAKGEKELSDLRDAFAEVYVQVMVFVSEMQHVFTVLAISPHSHMETYYGSMRSLNASSKLWSSYCGAIAALCTLFPTRNLGTPQDCQVLLAPHREKNSQSRELLPMYQSDSLLVLLQINYQTMFDTTSTLFIIAHELGHSIFNETRCIRLEWMQKTLTASLLTGFFADMMDYPLVFLTNALDRKYKENLRERIDAIEKSKATISSLEMMQNELALHTISILTEAACQDLCASLAQDLRSEYRIAIDDVVDEFYIVFEDIHKGHCSRNDHLQYCFGNDSASEIAEFATGKFEKCYRDIFKKSIEVNVAFLELIARRTRCFDRQQVVRLMTYWGYLREECLKDDKALEIPIPRHSHDELKQKAREILTIFREMHSDIFACKAIGFSLDDYLSYIAGFVDSSPRLIAGEDDLLRVMAVCESTFADAGCTRLTTWLRDGDVCLYDTDVRVEALRQLAYIQQTPHYGYMVKYGEAVATSIDNHINGIMKDNGRRELLEAVRDFACDNGSVSQHLWRFWLDSMRSLQGD